MLRVVPRAMPGEAPGVRRMPTALFKASGDCGIDLKWKICSDVWYNQPSGSQQDEGNLSYKRKLSVAAGRNDCTRPLILHASSALLGLIPAHRRGMREAALPPQRAAFGEGRSVSSSVRNICPPPPALTPGIPSDPQSLLEDVGNPRIFTISRLHPCFRPF